MHRRQALARLAASLGVAAVLRAPAPRAQTAPPGKLVPQKPQAAPPLELDDVDGHAHKLAGYRGRVVLVNFWATWCAPCVAEMPSMQLLRERLGGRFEILAVNYGESRAKAADFARRMDLDFPILLDAFHRARHDWKVRLLPASYVIDAKGDVRYTALGEIDWTGEAVAKTLSALIARP